MFLRTKVLKGLQWLVAPTVFNVLLTMSPLAAGLKSFHPWNHSQHDGGGKRVRPGRGVGNQLLPRRSWSVAECGSDGTQAAIV
jgi:hypothetical protein